jgi:nucleotide-binding universal stress UspA family protein
MVLIKKILVPNDGSIYAEKATKFAVDLALKYDASITLLCVVEVIPESPFAKAAAPLIYRQVIKNAYKKAEACLRSTKEMALKLNVSIDHKTVEGDAAEEILIEAKNGGYDLIVMGTRGASGVKRWFIGSVTARIINHAQCPVLIVR